MGLRRLDEKYLGNVFLLPLFPRQIIMSESRKLVKSLNSCNNFNNMQFGLWDMTIHYGISYSALVIFPYCNELTYFNKKLG